MLTSDHIPHIDLWRGFLSFILWIKESLFMSSQHHVQIESCGRMLRTVVNSHHLWQVSIPVSHASGTLNPQHRHLSPISSFYQAIQLGTVCCRMSLSYLRTSHEIHSQLSYKSSYLVRLECHQASMSCYPCIDQMIACLFG